ncbi:myo-inositol-1(or 4)-monophosphatase [Primorskyibacter sedentarius]|uniref:Myo-inositol-1(Or 4)-monophosphatase n=1 Tax=Primorskyibacter sedentarius TaxID=745311 RepID=A0A4R3J910_9RHOB|nr:myo-inositol-1(or 4)-monophosphatase [Primorskyibacter sedentarius]
MDAPAAVLAAEDLSLLTRAAHAAGETALTFTGPSARSWDKPEGAGPVTEADLAVNETLKQILRDARPDYGWLSEEDADSSDRLSARRVFIIDPIDGTRSFIKGDTSWAHSIAVVEDGEVSAGVVYLPMQDKLYAAARGGGAVLNGAAIHAGRAEKLGGADVLLARAALEPHHWNGAPPAINRHLRPSLAYRMALIAQGRFDAMLTLRDSWEWDIAAGALICAEAGARVTDRRGNALSFNARHPKAHGVVAANPPLHRAFLAALRN